MLGTFVVTGGGFEGWCYEAYDKLWLNEGTILVVIKDDGYVHAFCPDDGRRYNMYRSEFEDFTIPIEWFETTKVSL